MKDCKTILNVLRLKQGNFTYADIREATGIGNSTVHDLNEKFEKMDYSLKELEVMDPKEVVKAFYGYTKPREDRPLPDYEDVYKKVTNPDIHMTEQECYEEYSRAHPDGYKFTQFKKYFRDWRTKNHLDADLRMAVNRKPGEVIYVDWLGDTLPAVRNPDDPDKPLKAHFFITTIGVSNYTFVEAFPDEKTKSFIEGIVHCLKFYNGIPKILKPDNTKAAVIKNTKNDLVLNSSLRDIEHFYGVIVVPAPPLKPRGKSTVENAVKWVENNLIGKLKGMLFNSFEDLNTAVTAKMEELNTRSFAHTKGNRKEMFLKFDKPVLRPLPADEYTVYDYKVVKVPNNYHVAVDDHYYSVPYVYYKQSVIVRSSYKEVIITDENNRVIARHDKAFMPYPKYITNEKHMPASHRFYAEQNRFTASDYLSWAAKYGPEMKEFISRIIASFEFEEQSYRSCNGILHLVNDMPIAAVKEAADRCIKANMIGYSYFKNIVKSVKKEYTANVRNRYDSSPSLGNNKLPDHKNIRGKENFK